MLPGPAQLASTRSLWAVPRQVPPTWSGARGSVGRGSSPQADRVTIVPANRIPAKTLRMGPPLLGWRLPRGGGDLLNGWTRNPAAFRNRGSGLLQALDDVEGARDGSSQAIGVAVTVHSDRVAVDASDAGAVGGHEL